jgi:hypothetical protein
MRVRYHETGKTDHVELVTGRNGWGGFDNDANVRQICN